MIKVSFTEEEISDLRELASNHPQPMCRRKGLVVLMKSQGCSNQDIRNVVNVCENSIRNYVKAFRQGGVKQLGTLNLYHPTSELKSHDEAVKEYLDKTPPSILNSK